MFNACFLNQDNDGYFKNGNYLNLDYRLNPNYLNTKKES